jgi:hypothetical protein
MYGSMETLAIWFMADMFFLVTANYFMQLENLSLPLSSHTSAKIIPPSGQIQGDLRSGQAKINGKRFATSDGKKIYVEPLESQSRVALPKRGRNARADNGLYTLEAPPLPWHLL